MYYQGTNPSALRSRNEIIQAFLSLLNQYPLEDITIKQIMEYTELSRQTFYQIFDSKEDILECYLDIIFSDFIKESKKETITSLCDAARLFFAFFDHHKEILKKIIQNGKSCVVQRMCREYLHSENYIHYKINGANTNTEQEYSIIFIISGMVAMLEEWIKNTDKNDISADELADLLCRITNYREEREFIITS